MDKVVHFEIPVDDAARAREFYGSAFDWDLNEMDMGGGNMYTTVTTTPIDEATRQPTEPGGINGGLMQRTGDTPAPVVTIGPRSRTWAPSPTSRTARTTWSGCGRTSDHLNTGRPGQGSSHSPSRISTRPASSFDSRHAWISCGVIRR